MAAGHRILTLERLFNIREGFSRKNDTLPRRFLLDEKPSGRARGNLLIEPMLDEFYGAMGWDAESRPTADTLKSLGLELSMGREGRRFL